MAPEIPLQIWMADVPWGQSSDRRPVVFMGHRSSDLLVLLRISGNLDLMREEDFLIEDSHPDFGATNLAKSSFVEAQMVAVKPERFRRELGALEGALRAAFIAWLESGVLR